MSKRNMKIVRRLLEEVWTKGNLALVEELVAENSVARPMPQMDAVLGPEGYREFIAIYKGAFLAMEFTIEDQFAADSKVATRWISRVTDAAGDALADDATGEQVIIDGITITHHDSSGKIVAEWATWDTQSLMESAAAPEIYRQLSITI